jgi:hypothetical protein
MWEGVSRRGLVGSKAPGCVGVQEKDESRCQLTRLFQERSSSGAVNQAGRGGHKNEIGRGLTADRDL